MIYKTAFFLPNLEKQGGFVVSVENLANGFKEEGHEVHLFALGKTEIQSSPFINSINSDKKLEQVKIIKPIFTLEEEKKPFDIIFSNNFLTTDIVNKLCSSNKHYIILRQPSLLKQRYLSHLKYFFIFRKRYATTLFNY